MEPRCSSPPLNASLQLPKLNSFFFTLLKAWRQTLLRAWRLGTILSTQKTEKKTFSLHWVSIMLCYLHAPLGRRLCWGQGQELLGTPSTVRGASCTKWMICCNRMKPAFYLHLWERSTSKESAHLVASSVDSLLGKKKQLSWISLTWPPFFWPPRSFVQENKSEQPGANAGHTWMPAVLAL